MNDSSTRTTKVSTVMQQQVVCAKRHACLSCDCDQVYILCYCLITPAVSAPVPAQAASVAMSFPASSSLSSSSSAAALSTSAAARTNTAPVAAVLTSEEEDEEELSNVVAGPENCGRATLAASAAAAHARAASLSVRPPPGFSSEIPLHPYSRGIALPVKLTRACA